MPDSDTDDKDENQYFKVSHEYTDFRGHPQEEEITVIAPDEESAKKQARVQFHEEVEDPDSIEARTL